MQSNSTLIGVLVLLVVGFSGNAIAFQTQTQLKIISGQPLDNISQQLTANSFGDVSITQSGVLKISHLRFEGDVEVSYYPDGIVQGVALDNSDGDKKYRLAYSLSWSVSSSSWTLTAHLPPQEHITDITLWCTSCIINHAIVSNTTLATAKIGGNQRRGGAAVAIMLSNAELACNTTRTDSTTLPMHNTQRTLLATSCDDSVVVNGVATTFDTCLDLSKGAAPFFLYASLEEAPRGQKGTIFRGGIRAKTSGWAGIAFPQKEGGGMINSSAVIVMPSNSSKTSAHVGGFLLKSYDALAINMARGTYEILESAAEHDSKGYLVCTFSVMLPAWVEVPSPMPIDILFALGEMLPSGLLGKHIGPGSSYGARPLQLDMPVNKLPPSAPLVVTENVNAEGLCSLDVSLANGNKRTFASCLRLENIGVDFSIAWDIEADKNDSNSTILTIAMVSSGDKYVSVGFPSVPGSMLDCPAVIMQPCRKETAGTSGATCKNGAEIYEVYMIGYKVDDVFRDSRLGASNLTARRNAATGAMVGSFQVTLQGISLVARRRTLLAAGLDEFPLIFASGAVLPSGVPGKHYREYGSATIDLTQAGFTDTDLNVGGDCATKTAHMWLMALGWGVFVPLGIVISRILKSKDPGKLQMQKVGSKSVDNDNGTEINNDGTELQLQKVGSKIVDNDGTDGDGTSTSATDTDWHNGDETPPKEAENEDPDPITAAFTSTTPIAYWFQLHRALEALGFLMGCVGIALGFVTTGRWESPRPQVAVHRDIGMAVTVLGVAQVMAIVWRPKPGTQLRRSWAFAHRWLGRSVAILAIANIYYGMLAVQHIGTWALATYSSVLGLIVLAAVVNEIPECMRGRRQSEMPKGASQPNSLSSNQDGCCEA